MAMDGTARTAAPCDRAQLHPTSTLQDDERSPLAPGTSTPAGLTASRRGRVVSIAATLFLAGALATLTLRPATRESSLTKVDTGATEQKFVGAAIGALAEALIGGAGLAREFSKDYTDIEKLLHERGFSDELTEFSRRISAKVRDREMTFDNETWTKFLNTTNIDQIRLMLKPHLNRHDGNTCMDDEEQHAGLCYKTCKALTDDEYPIRVSAFSCCRKAPCIWADMRFEFSVCGGFDVSGDKSLNRCPHIPGACFANEELYYGLCYKQCAMLTEGKYGWRTGPDTCCVFRYAAGCGAAGTEAGGSYSVTDPAFAVGGGTGEPGSPKTVHPPILKLTEDPGDLEDEVEFDRIEQEMQDELAEEKAAAEDAKDAAEDKDCEEKMGAKYGTTIGKMACEAARAAANDSDKQKKDDAATDDDDAADDDDDTDDDDDADDAAPDDAPAPAPDRRAQDGAQETEKAGTKEEAAAVKKLDEAIGQLAKHLGQQKEEAAPQRRAIDGDDEIDKMGTKQEPPATKKLEEAVGKLAKDLGHQKEEAAPERNAKDGPKEAKKADTKEQMASLKKIDEAVEKLSKDVAELAVSLKSVDK